MQMQMQTLDDCTPQDLRVEKAILWYQDIESQEAAADDELEDILMEKGIISGGKLFETP